MEAQRVEEAAREPAYAQFRDQDGACRDKGTTPVLFQSFFPSPKTIEMGINVREYCAGLVRLGSLHVKLEGLRQEIQQGEIVGDALKELNRYGNTIYLEYMMLHSEMVRLKKEVGADEEREIMELTFSEEEVAYIAAMKPVLTAS